jgi:hypothetical protein
LSGFLSDNEVKTLALDGLVGVLFQEESLPVCSILRRTKVVDDSSAGAVSPGRISWAARLILPGSVQRLREGSPELRGDFIMCPVKTFIATCRTRTVWMDADAAGLIVIVVFIARLPSIEI